MFWITFYENMWILFWSGISRWWLFRCKESVCCKDANSYRW